MSLYNTVGGMHAEMVVLLSPFLPRRAEDFPRFRDIFVKAEDTDIQGDVYVYTRMGGGNRDCWEQSEPGCECPACDANALEAHEQCVGRYDDECDSTYSTFVWRVSDEQRADYQALIESRFSHLSGAYRSKLREQRADGGAPTRGFLTMFFGLADSPAADK